MITVSKKDLRVAWMWGGRLDFVLPAMLSFEGFEKYVRIRRLSGIINITVAFYSGYYTNWEKEPLGMT